VRESASEKAKLKRGDPPKIDFKKKGEHPIKIQNMYKVNSDNDQKFVVDSTTNIL
jgi:hypothetical protein